MWVQGSVMEQELQTEMKRVLQTATAWAQMSGSKWAKEQGLCSGGGGAAQSDNRWVAGASGSGLERNLAPVRARAARAWGPAQARR